MKPVMYIFLNKGAGMSTGKSSAQAAHAAVEAFRISDPELVDAWYVGGHHTKIVLEARDAEHLITVSHYLADRGFSSKIIIDEGRTEVEPHTITALGCAIVDKGDEHTAASFGGFKLYKDPAPPLDLRAAYNAVGANGHLNWRGREHRKDGLPIELKNAQLRGT